MGSKIPPSPAVEEGGISSGGSLELQVTCILKLLRMLLE